MFGLWYISLAIQELRKYLGWSSVFDVFKSNKTDDKTALQDKKPSETSTKLKDDIPKKPTELPKVQEKKSEPKQPTKPAVELPKVQEKVPADNKPVISQKPSVDIPKPMPAELPKPKTPELEKPLSPTKSVDVIPKPIIVPTVPAAPTNGISDKSTSSPNKQNEFDKKIFGSFVENGDNKETPKTNMKDATSSFLEEEGRGGTLRQKRDALAAARNKSDTMVDAAILKKMEDGYAKLMASDSKSLLKKHLSKEVFDKLKNTKTPTFGSTLLDCIQSGLENHDSGFGIYAPDAEAYSVFSEVFDPMIEDYHTGFKKSDKHPNREFGDVNAFGNLDPTGEYVVSTRVRCGRSMEGYPFNPCLTEAQYKEMETKVASTLSGLEGELKGKFYPLTGMDKAVQQQLIDDHFLFKEGDRFLQSANACRYWPSGRGIYHNDNKTFLVWCNEEDHLRIISMQMGGDLGQVYRRLVTAVNDIEKRIPFSHHDRLGFLTFCPTNLGTTIRASVHIKVPKLAANKAKLEEVAAKYNLQVRGTRGEHTEAEGGIYDISNKRRMGLTEFQAVKEMYDGISEIIKLEKSL